MADIKKILDRNKSWAKHVCDSDPNFFKNLAEQQKPEYLWIGCSDSRVPANQITGLAPGQVFVHRNVANVVVNSDLNCLSVIQYAVDVLQVKHILVCGHYGCGGVQAALEGAEFGLIDNWLHHVQNVYRKNKEQLLSFDNEEDRLNRLCELNVIEQVYHVGQTTIVRDAWARGQSLHLHGIVYGLSDGVLRDLKMGVDSFEELEQQFQIAVEGWKPQ